LAEFLRVRVQRVDIDRRPVDSAEARIVYLHLVRAATGAFLDATAYDAACQAAAQCAAGRCEATAPATTGAPR
jgi:hypothetical protein